MATCKNGIGVQYLSSFSLLLHWLHVSSPKGALTPCHNSSHSNFHQGTVFTRASTVDHFLDKLFQLPDDVPTQCPRGVHSVELSLRDSFSTSRHFRWQPEEYLQGAALRI